MKHILDLPVIRKLHERRLLFPAVIGLCVSGVLIHGALTRKAPSLSAPELELPLPPITVPSLRPSLEKSPLTYESDYWWQLAENVRNKLVQIGPNHRAAVMVGPGVALTTMAAVGEVEAEFHPLPAGGDVVTAEERVSLSTPPYRTLGTDAALGLALFGVKQPKGVGNFEPSQLSDLHAGTYVVAIGLGRDGEVQVAPGYVTAISPASGDTPAKISFSITVPDSCETAAIVDLDGDLVGISVKTPNGRDVVSVDELPGLIERLTTGGLCPAIEVADLAAEARKLLGIREGVFVERIRQEAFIPAPSIHAGDILISWDRQPIPDRSAFEELYARTPPGELVRYVVVRDRRRIRGKTRMPGSDCRPAGPGLRLYPQLGLSVEWADGGWRVIRVIPESPSEKAGLRLGDLITGVEGRTIANRDSSAFEHFETSPAPLALTLRRDERLKFLVVTPGAEAGQP